MTYTEVKFWSQLVAEVGLPMIVILWFMWRMEKRIERNTEVLNRVEKQLDQKED